MNLKTTRNRLIHVGFFAGAMALAGCSGSSSDSGTETATTTTTTAATARYTLTFSDTVASPGSRINKIPNGVLINEPFYIDVVVENATASSKSNRWEYKDAVSITYRAGLWSATVNPQRGGADLMEGYFETNEVGQLVAVPANWSQEGLENSGQVDSNSEPIASWYLHRCTIRMIGNRDLVDQPYIDCTAGTTSDPAKWSIR